MTYSSAVPEETRTPTRSPTPMPAPARRRRRRRPPQQRGVGEHPAAGVDRGARGASRRSPRARRAGCASEPPARRGTPTRRSRGAGWMAQRQDPRPRRGCRTPAAAGGVRVAATGAGRVGRGGGGFLGTPVPARSGPCRHPRRRRPRRGARWDGGGGTTGIRSVSPSVAGTRTAPGVRRGSRRGGRAVERTCVLAGRPGGPSGRRPGRGTSHASGSRAGPVERDRRPGAGATHAGTSGLRGSGSRSAVPERPGTTGRRDVAPTGSDDTGRGSDPESGRARTGSPTGTPRRPEVRGAGRASRGSARAAGPERPAPGSYAHPVRWLGRPRPGGWTRPCRPLRPAHPVIMSRCPGRPFVRAAAPVVRASLPMRSPSPTAGSLVATPRDRTLPEHPDNRATSDVTCQRYARLRFTHRRQSLGRTRRMATHSRQAAL